MQKIKGLMALSLFALPMLVACPAPEEEAPSEERVSCDPEKPTDCPDDQICHPYARVCVDNCAMVEDACGGELDSCGTEAPFVNICECTTTATCGDEEVCHPVTHLCEDTCDPMDDQCPLVGDEQWVCYAVEGESYDVDEGDAGVMTYDVYACQPPPGSCTGNEEICDADTEHCGPNGECAPNCTNDNSVGDVNESDHVCLATGRWVALCDDSECDDGTRCDTDVASDNFNYCVDLLTLPCDTNGEMYTDAAGQDHVCVDGTWETACDADVCAPQWLLCQEDPDKTTFNQCDDADNVTNTGCDGSASFTDLRDEDGPIIHHLAYGEADDQTLCDHDTGTTAYLVSFHYTDPDGDAHITNSAGYDDFLWAEDDSGSSVSSNALMFESGASEESGNASMVICFVSAPESLAVQISDASANVSNVACVTRDDLLEVPTDGEPSE